MGVGTSLGRPVGVVTTPNFSFVKLESTLDVAILAFCVGKTTLQADSIGIPWKLYPEHVKRTMHMI